MRPTAWDGPAPDCNAAHQNEEGSGVVCWARDGGYGGEVTHDTGTDRRSIRLLTSVAALVVVVATAACGGASDASTRGAAVTSTTTQTATHLVGKRYCEVLLVHQGSDGLYADVYNSYPLNSCPADQWAALDAAAIAKDHAALFAELNGPRFWLMDSIRKVRTSAQQVATFGGIAMILEATVQIGPNIVAAQAPYTPHTVNRQAAFTFDAGRQVYELVASDGTVWIMQTYSQFKDPTLAESDLPGLASRLTLPAGWSYRVRTLDSPLVVATASTSAHVRQDNLQNSYSEESAG